VRKGCQRPSPVPWCGDFVSSLNPEGAPLVAARRALDLLTLLKFSVGLSMPEWSILKTDQTVIGTTPGTTLVPIQPTTVTVTAVLTVY